MGGSSKKQKIGYKIYLGVHMIFVHGPIDWWLRFQFDNKTAWEGQVAGGTIDIDQEDLFGGEEREGGVSGAVDLESGAIDQGRNAYLQSLHGADIPAFRRVAGAVFNKFYWGMNPYLKIVNARLSRIHKTTDGAEQWNDEKAGVPNPSSTTMTFTRALEDFSEGLDAYSVVTTSKDAFSIVGTPYGDGMRLLTPAPVTAYSIERVLPSIRPTQVAFKCMVGAQGPDDVGRVYFKDSVNGQIFQFDIGRDGSFDALRRPQLNPPFAGNGQPLSTDDLPNGVWHQFVADFDYDANTITATLSVVGGAVLGSATDDIPPGAALDRLQFTLDANDVGNTSTFADFTVSYEGGIADDMNPAHIIRECLTDPDWGMGYLADDIDDASFTAAASTLWDERMGMSLLWDRQMTIEDFVKEVIRHINAALYVSRTDGKFVLKLIRADYDEETLPVFGPDIIERIDNYSYTAPGDLVNSVTVNFWDGNLNEQGSVTETDPALVIMEGAMIGTTVQYPGFTNKELASRIALRDLQTLSTPLRSCTVFANRAAEDLNIGDVFKLNWPDYGSEPIVMRILGMGLGDGKSNKIRLQVTQDQFAMPVESTITPPATEWTDPTGGEVNPVDVRVVMEAPYVELLGQVGQSALDGILSTEPTAGYVVASGARPSGSAINARILVDAGAGYTNKGETDFSPTFTLLAPVTKDPTDDDFSVNAGVDPTLLAVGMHGTVNEEQVEVTAIAPGVLTVKRAILDTVPGEHAIGDKVVFWSAYAQGDETQYVDSEMIDVKLQTVGASVLPESAAPVDTVAMASRAIRPYPPGQFKVAAAYYPTLAWGAVTTSWVHRDRVLQADELVGTAETGIGPEPGTTYNIRYYIDGVLVHTSAGVAGTSDIYSPPANGALRVELESERDGFVSWQQHSAEMTYTIVEPGGYLLEDSSGVYLTEAGDRLITE